MVVTVPEYISYGGSVFVLSTVKVKYLLYKHSGLLSDLSCIYTRKYQAKCIKPLRTYIDKHTGAPKRVMLLSKQTWQSYMSFKWSSVEYMWWVCDAASLIMAVS